MTYFGATAFLEIYEKISTEKLLNF